MGQRGGSVQGGEPVHANYFIRRDSPQHRSCSVARRVNDDEIPQTFEDVLDESSGVISGLHDAVDCSKSMSGIATPNRVEGLVQKFTRCVAQQVVRAFACDRVVVRTRNDLVENRESVAD